MSYSDQLRDPRWQRKRLEILNRSDFSCEECGAKDRTLNVHHKQYRKGAKPWEYSDYELASLCEQCHQLRHLYQDEVVGCMADLTIVELREFWLKAAHLWADIVNARPEAEGPQ